MIELERIYEDLVKDLEQEFDEFEGFQDSFAVEALHYLAEKDLLGGFMLKIFPYFIENKIDQLHMESTEE